MYLNRELTKIEEMDTGNLANLPSGSKTACSETSSTASTTTVITTVVDPTTMEVIKPTTTMEVVKSTTTTTPAGWKIVEGYLVDKLCATKGKGAKSPGGIDVFATPEQHSLGCLLMPSCLASGFVVMSAGEIAYSLTEEEDDRVREWIQSDKEVTNIPASEHGETQGLQVTVKVYGGTDISQANLIQPECWESTPNPAIETCNVENDQNDLGTTAATATSGNTSDPDPNSASSGVEAKKRRNNPGTTAGITIAVLLVLAGGGVFVAVKKGWVGSKAKGPRTVYGHMENASSEMPGGDQMDTSNPTYGDMPGQSSI